MFKPKLQSSPSQDRRMGIFCFSPLHLRKRTVPEVQQISTKYTKKQMDSPFGKHMRLASHKRQDRITELAQDWLFWSWVLVHHFVFWASVCSRVSKDDPISSGLLWEVNGTMYVTLLFKNRKRYTSYIRSYLPLIACIIR